MTTATKSKGKFASINVDAMEKWLTALESDEFQQAKSALHEIRPQGESMCCLGVVSHVLKDECELKVTQTFFTDEYTEVLYNNSGSYLPVEVAQYLGIPNSHLDYMGSDTVNILVTLNEKEAKILGSFHASSDTVGVSRLNDSNLFDFKEIARMLRREFLITEETINA